MSRFRTAALMAATAILVGATVSAQDPCPTSPPPAAGALPMLLGIPSDVGSDDGSGFVPWFTVAVTEVRFSTGTGEYDKPDVGRLFYGFHVAYVAVGPHASASVIDWQASADGEVLPFATRFGDTAEPDLAQVFNLPAGRTTQGWVWFQGPNRKGANVALDFFGAIGQPPIYELLVHCCDRLP